MLQTSPDPINNPSSGSWALGSQSLLFHFFFVFFWPHHMTCGILVPQLGIVPEPLAVEAKKFPGLPENFFSGFNSPDSSALVTPKQDSAPRPRLLRDPVPGCRRRLTQSTPGIFMHQHSQIQHLEGTGSPALHPKPEDSSGSFCLLGLKLMVLSLTNCTTTPPVSVPQARQLASP